MLWIHLRSLDNVEYDIGRFGRAVRALARAVSHEGHFG